MTVKELKEQLSEFKDNIIVMIPKVDSVDDYDFPYRTVHSISQGVNECDGCIFLESVVCCENCLFDPCGPEEEPCLSCTNYSDWEPKGDQAEE